MRARTRMLGTAVVSLLLVASGTVLAAASWQRWWPACRLGDFDAPRCVDLQNHFYDFVVLSDDWIAIGNTAGQAATSLLLLAVALGALPSVLAPDVTGWFPIGLGAFMAAPVLFFATTTWVASRSGEPTEVPGAGWMFLWYAVGLPLALLATLVLPGTENSLVRLTGRILLAGLLSISTPLVAFMLSSPVMGYGSHDTVPWTETLVGAALVGAGLAVWPATWHRRVRSAPHEETARVSVLDAGGPASRHRR